MDNAVKKAAWASAYFNGDFYFIETCSGYRGGMGDQQGKQHLLPSDVGNDELGLALQDALAHSRFITDEKELRRFYNYEKRGVEYAKWVEMLMKRYGYKSKRELFIAMMWCNITDQDRVIEIGPTRHEKLEAWGREKDDEIEDVVISKNAPPEEIGAALREAFNRCVD